MALPQDRYPNLPGIQLALNDGNLTPDVAPAGPRVGILGSATKGVARLPRTVSSGASAISSFGTIGSLGRGLAEAFQGGAQNAFGYRMFAQQGKLEHIGDDSGVDGLTIESTQAGHDSLERFSILFNQKTSTLTVYDVASGARVYRSVGDVVEEDFGLVSVTGSIVNDITTTPQVFGSIGRHLPVQDSPALQKATVGADAKTFTMVASAGLNLGKLGFVNATSTPIMVQLRSADGSVLVEELLSSVTVSTGVFVLGTAINDSYLIANTSGFAEDYGGATVEHEVRFISLTQPQRMDQVADYRLAKADDIFGETEILVVPGSDFSALPRLHKSGGLLVDTSLIEPFPHKMNLYEGLIDAALDLEGEDFSYLVLMDAYMDDPALDGQTTGETKLPTKESEGLLFDNAVNADAGIDEVSSLTLKYKDRIILGFDSASERASAISKLASAGRGQSWIVFSEPQGVKFGQNLLPDELVRTARIINWEATGREQVVIAFGADVDDNQDGTHWDFTDGKTSWYVWYDTGAGAGDPAPAGKTGIEVTVDTGHSAVEMAEATLEALKASEANVDVFRTGPSELTMVAREPAELADTAAGATPVVGFTFTVTDGSSTDLLIHLDRDVGFSVDSVTGIPVAAQKPEFKVYSTDLLFFHREKEIDGEIVHFWYTDKTDTEGNLYHEVNFAYKLGQICHERTESEVFTLGVIGVRPPSNHYNMASVMSWIGKSPVYDEDGDVSSNGTGLLGNKFLAGRGLDGLYADGNQFDSGFKATVSGHLDDEDVLLDNNDFEVDLGKYLSIVATWPVMTNASDGSGIGYIASGAPLYTGLLASLPSWLGSTAKAIGGRNVRLPVKLRKRHLDALSGVRLVTFSLAGTQVTVVDGPSAALPTSDFQRNMSMRLVADAVERIRRVARPYLGDPLNNIKKTALDTALKANLSSLQRLSGGTLESFELGITQSRIDELRGSARVALGMFIKNEFRKLVVEVSLTL